MWPRLRSCLVDKLNRNYIMSVQKRGSGSFIETGPTGYRTITPPFSVEFDIQRKFWSGSIDSNFRIYNLSKESQSDIRFDETDTGSLRTISFAAGYAGNMPQLFFGTLNQAWSVREGTNVITSITASDKGFALMNATSSVSFKTGTPIRAIISQLMQSLSSYGIGMGVIGDFPGEISRGNAYSGSTIDILTQLSGGGFFIDNGKGYCLKDNEALQGSINLIDPSTGLLNTPVRQNRILTLDIIFEPRIILGQAIELKSVTGDNGTNGLWIVGSVHHKGIISPVTSGTAVTSLELFNPYGEISTVLPS